MIRTQIYIPKKLHQRAKQVAKEKGDSLASLLRGYITAGLDQEEKKKPGFEALITLGLTGGPKDLSEHMDDYLYGNR